MSASSRSVKQIDMDLDMLDRGGFPHFMLKEIFDQPRCLRDCMSGRLFDDKVILSAVRNNRARLLSATRFIIVAWRWTMPRSSVIAIP